MADDLHPRYAELQKHHGFIFQRLRDTFQDAAKNCAWDDYLPLIYEELNELARVSRELRPLHAQEREHERQRLAEIRERVQAEQLERQRQAAAERAAKRAQGRAEYEQIVRREF